MLPINHKKEEALTIDVEIFKIDARTAPFPYLLDTFLPLYFVPSTLASGLIALAGRYSYVPKLVVSRFKGPFSF